MEMCMDIKTFVRVEYMRSDLFDVKVGVHQGSVLCPLLLAVVMDEVTKNIRENVVKRILYEDDLLLLEVDWEEVEYHYSQKKEVLKDKGMKVNVNKTIALYKGRRIIKMHTYKYLCSVCKKGVGRNSILCASCKNWVHKRCSRTKGNLANATNFECKQCQGFIDQKHR